MEDVKFVLKTLAVTIIVVFLMQIRVGNNTIEASTHAWIQNSAVTELMRGVADGGIKVAGDFYGWVRAKTGPKEEEKTSFWPWNWSFGSSSKSTARALPEATIESDEESVSPERRPHHAVSANSDLLEEGGSTRESKRRHAREVSNEEIQRNETGHFHWGGGSHSHRDASTNEDGAEPAD